MQAKFYHCAPSSCKFHKIHSNWRTIYRSKPFKTRCSMTPCFLRLSAFPGKHNCAVTNTIKKRGSSVELPRFLVHKYAE